MAHEFGNIVSPFHRQNTEIYVLTSLLSVVAQTERQGMTCEVSLPTFCRTFALKFSFVQSSEKFCLILVQLYMILMRAGIHSCDSSFGYCLLLEGVTRQAVYVA